MKELSSAERLAGLVSDLAEQGDEVLTTKLIVARAVEVTPGADHASVTVKDRRSYRTLAATSELAAYLDGSQYRLGEGPCVAGTELGEWFVSRDVLHDARWPRWGLAASARGVGSMLSVRLSERGKPFGALNLYSLHRGSFTEPGEVEVALLYAVHAAHALVTSRLVTNLETAMASRHTIGIAQGIVMTTYGVSQDQAFATLTRVSQETNVKLRDVAAEVVRSGALPGVDAPTA